MNRWLISSSAKAVSTHARLGLLVALGDKANLGEPFQSSCPRFQTPK